MELKLRTPIATLRKNEARIQLPTLTKGKNQETKTAILKRIEIFVIAPILQKKNPTSEQIDKLIKFQMIRKWDAAKIKKNHSKYKMSILNWI